MRSKTLPEPGGRVNPLGCVRSPQCGSAAGTKRTTRLGDPRGAQTAESRMWAGAPIRARLEAFVERLEGLKPERQTPAYSSSVALNSVSETQ